MTMRVTLRMVFESGLWLGPGKVALLEAIERTGSIAAAGREFDMSYRRAWTLVNELNRMFLEPCVDAREGGRNGGGAIVTPFGRHIVALYRSAERHMHESGAAELAAIEAVAGPARN